MIGMIGLRQCVAKRHKGGAAPSPRSPQPPNNWCTHLQPNNCCYCGAFVGFQHQNAADSVRMIGLSFKTLQIPYKSIFFFQHAAEINVLYFKMLQLPFKYERFEFQNAADVKYCLILSKKCDSFLIITATLFFDPLAMLQNCQPLVSSGQTFSSVISPNRVTKAYDKQKPDMSLSTHARICGCVDRTLWPPISTRHGLKKPLVQRSEQSICAMMNLPMHDKAFYAMHCWVQMVFEIYNVCIHNIYIYIL